MGLTVEQPAALLVEAREALPGRWLQTWQAPRLAAAVQPGQYVHALAAIGPGGAIARLRGPGGLLEALPIAGYERGRGLVRTLVGPGRESPGLGLASMRPGDRAILDGPLGQGFHLEPRSLHVLVVADPAGLPRVQALVDEAVASGRRVALLHGAPSAGMVFPSSLLADEVEYVVATADGSLGHRGPVTDLVADYEAWADQCFAAGSIGLLSGLVALARGRDQRMGVARLGRRRGRRPSPAGRSQARRKAWLQVALEHSMGCALGVCLGCVVTGSAGSLRACREGPVFGAEELGEGLGA